MSAINETEWDLLWVAIVAPSAVRQSALLPWSSEENIQLTYISKWITTSWTFRPLLFATSVWRYDLFPYWVFLFLPLRMLSSTCSPVSLPAMRRFTRWGRLSFVGLLLWTEYRCSEGVGNGYTENRNITGCNSRCVTQHPNRIRAVIVNCVIWWMSHKHTVLATSDLW